MSIKKKHHYIPVFYLKGFVDPRNKPFIWIYEKGNPNIKKANPESTAFTNYFYAFTTPEGTMDSETFENVLAIVESQVSPILKKIKEYKVLDNLERSGFATFLSFMMTRTPSFREHVESVTAGLINNTLTFIASDKERYKSFINSEGGEEKELGLSIEEQRRLILDGKIKAEVHPQASLNEIYPIAKEFAPIFFDLNWTFLKAKNEFKFSTSDNPLALVDPTHDPKSPFGVGLLKKNIEVTFPISPDLSFLGTWDKYREDYEEASNETIRQINKRTVIKAKRFIYSSKKDEAFNRMVQKYKETTIPGPRYYFRANQE